MLYHNVGHILIFATFFNLMILFFLYLCALLMRYVHFGLFVLKKIIFAVFIIIIYYYYYYFIILLFLKKNPFLARHFPLCLKS